MNYIRNSKFINFLDTKSDYIMKKNKIKFLAPTGFEHATLEFKIFIIVG